LNEGGEYADIFRESPDRYEGMARIVGKKLGMPFNAEKFKEERTSYKVGTLARTYGMYVTNLIRKTGNKEFAKTLDAYFKDNARYMAYVENINRMIATRKEIVIRDYFGVERAIVVRRKDRHVIFQCLNTPIQSTSNSIVINFVNAVIKRFRALGFGPDKFRVYLIRHDEPVFMIHKDCRPYINLIRDYQTVAVDDWSLLTMHGEVGYNYGVRDEELTKDLEKEFEETPRFALEHKDYSPISEQRVLRIYAEGDKLLVANEMDLFENYKFKLVGDPVFSTKRAIETLALEKNWNDVTVNVEIPGDIWFGVENNGNVFRYVDRSNERVLLSLFRQEFKVS
jgi:hypothetical protein